MAVLKCKMCGGDIEVNENMTLGTCMYCGSTMTVPRIDNEKKARLFNHANQYRLNNEFDKAYDAYKAIVDEDEQEAEAYWGLILSEYGVEYVEDPKTKKRLPTCHRTHVQAIQNSTNYELACKYADAESRFMYQDEAEVLDQLQKKIISISTKEEPYDVFICYKETDDATGERTEDSVLAQEIYNELTKQGIRVFFARISLEDKLGQSYEPYIYAALQSASVMLHVTMSSEHSNAIWVKNEWKRYIDFMGENDNKTLIPVYRNISPYELPAELTRYQAQDMSKVGAIQDLVYGVQKLVKGRASENSVGLKKEEKDLLNKLEKNQRNTKLFISFVVVLLLEFLGMVILSSSTSFRMLFLTPKGSITVGQLPGPNIWGFPLSCICIAVIYDAGIICNVIQGLKSKIAHGIYFAMFVIGTIILGVLRCCQMKPTKTTLILYAIMGLLALISSVTTYRKDKKKILLCFGIGVLSALFLIGALIFGPTQSNKRDESVNQIKVTTQYINLRKKSSLQGKIVGRVYRGEVFTVLEEVETSKYIWYKIRTANGETGYVASGDNYIEYLQAEK